MHTPDLGLPGLEDPVPPSWTTIEDDFVLIYVVKQVFPNAIAVCLHSTAMSIISYVIKDTCLLFGKLGAEVGVIWYIHIYGFYNVGQMPKADHYYKSILSPVACYPKLYEEGKRLAVAVGNTVTNRNLD